MSLLANSMAALGTFATDVILRLGYFGIFFLMALESTAVPLPAELVMPFAGFLAAKGQFSLTLIIITAVLGTLAGSLFSYYLGMYGGNKLVRRYGRYVLLDEEDLAKTEEWFAKRGERTIFIGRFVPVVRHLISIPAGIGKMNLGKFLFYTALGGGIWNAILTLLGFYLGRNWELVRQYTEPFSVAIVIIMIGGLAFFVYHHLRKKGRRAQKR
jgi:membrane protein DedA with SNARE-associated domain